MSNLQNILKDVNGRFNYQPDQRTYDRRDRWAVMREINWPMYGDCEDYALTVLWHICGRDDDKLLQSLENGDAHIWYCKLNGVGHAILEYNGKFIDNNIKSFVDESDLSRYELIRRFTYGEIYNRIKWQIE